MYWAVGSLKHSMAILQTLSLNLHMCEYMWICVYMSIYMYMYMYVYVHIYMYVYMYKICNQQSIIQFFFQKEKPAQIHSWVWQKHIIRQIGFKSYIRSQLSRWMRSWMKRCDCCSGALKEQNMWKCVFGANKRQLLGVMGCSWHSMKVRLFNVSQWAVLGIKCCPWLKRGVC